MSSPLDRLSSVKVKLGFLVAVSVVVAALVGALGASADVALWLSLPVTVALALGVTQLLAVGMTSPLREMTAAARRMARGDYSTRVAATSNDEVGELARTFNTMAEDLGDVDRQRRELVASVSHELRTPLAGLTAVLENAVDGVGGPVALGTALERAERLSELVNDLLDLARAGAVPLSTSSVAIGDLVGRAVDEADGAGRDVRYDVRVTPADLSVEVDAQRLHQLVANLLDNASRHSPAGGTVTVAVTEQGSGWRLEVADDGPGIPAADRERVFERFGTLDDGGGGTGLGLAIARWVADLHHGAIRFIDPGPGRTGARVRVDLPHDPSDHPAAHHEEPVMSRPVPPPGPVPPPNPYVPLGAAPQAPEPMLDSLFGGFWPEEDLTHGRRTVLVALGVGVLAGIVLPFRDLGVGTFAVLLASGGAVLLAAVNRRQPFTVACTALCVLLAAASFVRAAEWIVVECLLAGAAVFVCGIVNGRTLQGYLLAGISWPMAAIRGLPWFGRSLRGAGRVGRSAAALRTLVLSVLGVVVFGLLFASADALFASWVDVLVPDLRVDTAVARTFIGVFVGGVVLAASYLALNPPRVDPSASPVRAAAQRYEWLVPVLLVDAVFAAFLLAQAAVVFGGHGYLRRTTGLTYADYVHQGFGQLTVATALTLLVVWAAARKASRETAGDVLALRASLGLLCAMTLVVVASALYRMHVYQEAYGFTRQRLLVDFFEGWLGLLVVLVMAAGVLLRAAWLPRAAVLTGAAAVVLLAGINPDAWIAEHNLDRYEATGKVDWTYLAGLSADMVPALEGRPDEVVLCALMGQRDRDDDWLEWNLGRHRAEDEIRFSLDHRGAGEPACLSAD